MTESYTKKDIRAAADSIRDSGERLTVPALIRKLEESDIVLSRGQVYRLKRGVGYVYSLYAGEFVAPGARALTLNEMGAPISDLLDDIGRVVNNLESPTVDVTSAKNDLDAARINFLARLPIQD